MNKGQAIETNLIVRYGFERRDAVNAKATESADLYRKGIGYQVKSDGATIANNNNNELLEDIIQEFGTLIKEDKADKILLVGTWKKLYHLFTFSKMGIMELVTDYPELLYYDYDSRTKKKKIRIKVKMKDDYILQRYCENLERLQ